MTFMSGIQSSVSHSANLRRWISRAFVVSILVYLVQTRAALARQ